MSALAKIGVLAGSCAIVLGLTACSSSETTDKPAIGTNSAPAAATTVASAEPAAAASTKPVAGTTTKPAAASGATDSRTRPMGATQVIKTAEFEAKVTVKEVDEPNGEELGDPSYAIDVRVQVTRGVYPAGTLLVQFVYANGSAHTRIEDPNGPHLAAELLAPSDETLRFLFEHPAGAGVGQGARITISEDGKALATWLT